jgi:membrane associated rhomboid family serine protease
VAFLPLYDTNPLRRIRWPWVAWSLIALNIIVYFFYEDGTFSQQPVNASATDFGLVPAYFNAALGHPITLTSVPDLITILTYSFLHADIWHLAGNMVFLWVFADNVEDALGHFRYFLFYLLCTAAAGYGFVLSDPLSEAPVIGASGAVAGNIAAYVLLYPRAKVWILLLFRLPLRLRVEWVLGFWIAFQLYSAFWGGDAEVAWWAHIGGLAAGALLVLVMRQKGVPLFAAALPEHPSRGLHILPEREPEAQPTRIEPPSVDPRRIDPRGPWE